MIYRVQECVLFRSEDGRIWIDDENSFILTATTSRLLTYFLKHHGDVISKEELLEKVWDAYGLSSSSNSLYKYISDLRAVFRNLGFKEDVILTVPKIGFSFSKLIAVKNIADDGSLLVQATDDGAHDVVPSSQSSSADREITVVACDGVTLKADYSATKSDVPVGLFQKYKKRILAGVFFVVPLVALMLVLDEINSPNRDQLPTYYIGSVGSCPVRSFTRHNQQKSLDVVNDIIANKGIRCLAESVYFVRVSETVLSGRKGRVFVALCHYKGPKRIKLGYCENYFREDYEIKP